MSSDLSLNPDIVRELKAARPEAPAALRRRVQEMGASAPAPGLRERLQGAFLFSVPRPRLALAAPLALLLVGAVAAAVAFHSDQGSNSYSANGGNGANGSLTGSNIPKDSAESANGAAPAATRAAGAQTGQKALAPAPPQSGRPQKVTTELTILVKGLEQLSRADAEAMRVAQRYGGYIASSDYSSGRSQPQPCPYTDSSTASNGSGIVPPCLYDVRQGRAGVAVIVLRVPSTHVADAMLDLVSLGRITSQHLAVEDLKAQEGQTQTSINRLLDRIAELRGQLASKSPTAVERQSLRAQLRDAETQLQSFEDQQSQTKDQAAYSTLTLTLETPLHKQVVKKPVHHGRVHKALEKAGDILLWEALGVFYVLVVAGPLALLLALGWLIWRRSRRARDERLLDES